MLTSNLAELFVQEAEAHPSRVAIDSSEGVFTYRDLYRRFQSYHHGLLARGFGPGDRVVLLLPVSVDLYAMILALFSIGAVGISIDASMPASKIRRCLAEARPKAILSVAAVLKHRFLLPRFWRTQFYCLERGGLHLAKLTQLESASLEQP